MRDLYHSTALVEAVKSLAPLNVKGHGKVPYQKPQLKSMVHGANPCIYRNVLAQCVVPTQCEQSITILTALNFKL